MFGSTLNLHHEHKSLLERNTIEGDSPVCVNEKIS